MMIRSMCKLTLVPIFFTVLLAACGRDASDEATTLFATRDSELIGQLKSVLVNDRYQFLYFVRGSEALILQTTDDTEYVNVEAMVEGDGFRWKDRLLHSSSVYRLRGTVSDLDSTSQVRLVSLETKTLTVESFELLEKGTGPCVMYFGRGLSAEADSNGFVAIIPESVRGKTGVFVQNGTGRCSIVSVDTGRGEELTNSFVGDGNINMNEQIDWATVESN